MIRASTPKHTFRFPVNPETQLRKIQVTYAQNGVKVLVKTENDMTFENRGTEGAPVYVGYYRLTQAETNLFQGDAYSEDAPDVLMQVRVLANDGTVAPTKKYRLKLFDVLNDDELTDDEEAEEVQSDDS